MNILGISAYYHDSAACLVRDGHIVAAAQEERFTRKKHDQGYPEHAIAYCLQAGNMGPDSLDYAVFYEKPFLKFERIVETSLSYAPRGLKSFLAASPLWLKDKLWMSEQIRKKLHGFRGQLLFTEHHEAHAASAFYPSPFEETAFLTADGAGEWTTTSWGVGRGSRLDILQELRFPHSLGLLYSAFTYYTGFKVNSGEYKMMGLAPYGEPSYASLIYDHLVDVKSDGSFKLNMEYFNYCSGLTMTSAKFHKLFRGEPRRPGSTLTRRDMDLAASIQKVTEDILLRMARNIRQETGQRRLCLAGGVALNCAANGKILREGIFEDIWVQPAAGDAGGALGAALFAWHHVLDGRRTPEKGKDSQKGSYLGPEFTDDEIACFLKIEEIPFEKYSQDELLSRTADLLSQGKVLGWFQGRMEYGPRALGNRSILGDPRLPEMQSRMNLKIKFRESFRPFAPAVLIEKASEYFDLDRPSPYMVFVADVREGKRRADRQDQRMTGVDRLGAVKSEIPAVTHVDHSARIQTVHRETNPLFHALIERFYEKTGCPVIVNTSFNVRGEPIVCTPEDAYRCFMRTDMDYLVLGNHVLAKSARKPDRHEAGIGQRLETASTISPVRGLLKELNSLAETPGVLRRFGILLTVLFAIVSAVLFSKGNLYWQTSGVAAVIFLLAALLHARTLYYPYRIWMSVALALGWLMNRLILTFVYFGVMTPIAVMLKILKKDVLDERMEKGAAGYWKRHVTDGRGGYKKQY